MNSAQKRSANVLCMGAVLTAAFAFVAVLGLMAVVQSQFRDQTLNFGMPWPTNFELPPAAMNFAAYAGAVLWLLMSYQGWSRVSVKSGFSGVIAAMVVACLRSVSVINSVVNLSVFPVMTSLAVWANAALTLLIATTSVGIFMDDLEDYRIRYSGA